MTDLHCDTASARLAQVVTGLTELACKRRQFVSLFIIIEKVTYITLYSLQISASG